MELNKVTLDSTIGEIKRSFNDGVLDAFGEVAAALKAEAANGGNALIDQALEQCKKTQDMYNTCLGYVDAIIQLARWGERKPTLLIVDGYALTFSLADNTTKAYVGSASDYD